MRLDRPSARDLLDRATELRAAIDWRRSALVGGDPRIDRIATAIKLNELEKSLIRTERVIVARARAITLEIKRTAKGDETCQPFRPR
jgi:hypothetical protein